MNAPAKAPARHPSMSAENQLPSWSAKAIHPDCDQGQGTQASFVTTTFSWPGPSEAPGGAALLHISAFGLYRAFINGTRVGADCLTPGWTCYDDRIAFQSYDVSALLRPGENRIDIWLGDGWYRSPMMWGDQAIPNTWGDKIAAFAQIEAGGSVILATDESWQSGLLPITQSGIYWGEDHDARIAPVPSHGVSLLDC